MVNSINSDSGYLALKTNNNVSRVNSSKETEKDLVYDKIQLSKNVVSSDSSVEGSPDMTIEDYMGMMQSFQKPAEISFVSDQSIADGNAGSIDADSDGTISTDEYENLISQLGLTDAPSTEEVFSALDTNEDGEISIDELEANKPSGPPPMVLPPEITKSSNLSDNLSATAENDNSSVQSSSSTGIDSTTNTSLEQYLTEEFRRLASNVINAYENNYQYAYGFDNENQSGSTI